MKIKLTPQQKKALDFFSKGLSLREISVTMGVSYQRILNLLNEILAKTPYSNRTELLLNLSSLEIE